MAWVKAKKYYEVTGDTHDAVHARRRRGEWVDGVHCQVRGGTLWINIEEVEAWIKQASNMPSPGA